jgi:predicted GNAT family acetyltransferase
LTWVERDGVRIAEHTLVPPEIGGRGIAALLVEALVSDAREQGFRIDPACSYVAAKFDQHPEWADLRS